MPAILTQERFDRETGYRTALSVMRNLHARGLLTDRESGQIEPILSEKFPFVWAGLIGVMRENDRITLAIWSFSR